MGWPPNRNAAGNPTGQYVVDCISEALAATPSTSSNGKAHRNTEPHGNPLTSLPVAQVWCGPGGVASVNANKPGVPLSSLPLPFHPNNPLSLATQRT